MREASASRYARIGSISSSIPYSANNLCETWRAICTMSRSPLLANSRHQRRRSISTSNRRRCPNCSIESKSHEFSKSESAVAALDGSLINTIIASIADSGRFVYLSVVGLAKVADSFRANASMLNVSPGSTRVYVCAMSVAYDDAIIILFDSGSESAVIPIVAAKPGKSRSTARNKPAISDGGYSAATSTRSVSCTSVVKKRETRRSISCFPLA